MEDVINPALGMGSGSAARSMQRPRPTPATRLGKARAGGVAEAFGLVAIELLATGTPVIARCAAALPEIIEHGVDGSQVDDVEEAVLAVRLAGGLDRRVI